jgi:NDP-sugar pyrophosphorylase family protein
MADTQETKYGSCRVTLGANVTEKGIMIAIGTADSKAYAAADAATRRVVGINQEVGSTNDKIVCTSGIYLFDNSAVYPVTQAYIGAKCYVEDSKTVSTSTGSNTVVAGTVVDVVSAGVYVRIGDCVTL